MVAVVGTGLGLGLVLSYLAAPVLGSLLFNVSATDPLTFVGVAMVLALMASAAAYLPARRAAHLDPMKALYPDPPRGRPQRRRGPVRHSGC